MNNENTITRVWLSKGKKADSSVDKYCLSSLRNVPRYAWVQVSAVCLVVLWSECTLSTQPILQVVLNFSQL